MRILQIKSSVFSGNGESSRLADAFVAELLEAHPKAEIAERDLAIDAVPHLDGARAAAFFAKPDERSDAQRAVIAYSDALIAELRRAEVLVLGLPMYNFGVPSQLKAWFDHVARAGETFKYTDKGSVGLLKGKRAYVFATRGGVYGDNHA
jgi:FMN-dependent NADH-azoreductase